MFCDGEVICENNHRAWAAEWQTGEFLVCKQQNPENCNKHSASAIESAASSEVKNKIQRPGLPAMKEQDSMNR